MGFAHLETDFISRNLILDNGRITKKNRSPVLMHYLIWTLLPVACATFVQQNRRYVISSFVFIIVYSALLGLQYNVGADYNSYTSFITNDELQRFTKKGEFASYFLMYCAQILSHANFYYLFVGFIVSTSACLIARLIPGSSFQNLLIVITTWSLLFSSYNTTRQVLSICVMNCVFLWLMTKEKPTSHLKWTFGQYMKSLVALSASAFHSSAFLVYPLYLLTSIKAAKFIALIIAPFLFLNLNAFIEIMFDINPLYMVYKSLYSESSLSVIMGKFYPSFVFLLLYLLKSVKLSHLLRHSFFVLYFLSLILVLLSYHLQHSIILRIYEYFSIFSLTPYFVIFNQGKFKNRSLAWCLVLFFPLLKITIFAKGEYFYNSILFI